MRTASLTVLGIKVPLKFRDVYHDDGFVSSVNEHTFKLVQQYGRGIIENRYGMDADPSTMRDSPGRYLFFPGVFRDHHHICYNDMGFMENLFLRGHEESEFLEEIDRLDLLAEKLMPHTNRPVNFKDIQDGEVRNHFGSAYAFLRNGVPVKKIFEVTKPHPQLAHLKLLLEHYGVL